MSRTTKNIYGHNDRIQSELFDPSGVGLMLELRTGGVATGYERSAPRADFDEVGSKAEDLEFYRLFALTYWLAVF